MEEGTLKRNMHVCPTHALYLVGSGIIEFGDNGVKRVVKSIAEALRGSLIK